MFYVVLRWSDYHNLLQNSDSRFFSKETKAKRFASSNDEVIFVASQSDAKKLVKAFNRLCAADWTPNQTPEDREFYDAQAADANAYIARARETSEYLKTANA